MEQQTTNGTVRRAYEELMRKERMRTRDAAQRLGVSELELLDAFPEYVVPLRPEFNAVFSCLGELGPLLALTRNEEAVLECSGVYAPFAYSEQSSLVLGDAVDLRLNLRHFAAARLIRPLNTLRVPGGVAFFDASGQAIHKAFFTADTVVDAAEQIESRFAAEQRHLSVPSRPSRTTAPVRAESGGEKKSVDARALRAAWAAMRDTHDIVDLLQSFGVSRLQAFEALGRDWAIPAAGDALWRLLTKVSATAFPIMIFVGNRAVTQIYKGPIEKAVLARGWWNVLDGRFNLHVDAGRLGPSWIVRKPVPEGHVTSLEVFNDRGELVLIVFSRRPVAQPEPAAWRELLASLPCLH